MSNYTDPVVARYEPDPPDGSPEPETTVEQTCKRCRGMGQVKGVDCAACEGWGSILR